VATASNPNLSDHVLTCAQGFGGIVGSTGFQFFPQCISDMSRQCSLRIVEGSNPLIDPTSNCYYFKQFLENSALQNATNARAMNELYLDPLKFQWCNAALNLNLSECACLNATKQGDLETQCNLNQTECGDTNPPMLNCKGRRFAKKLQGDVFGGTTLTGEFVNISFDQCLPYYCWVDACWNTDPDVFKTFDARSSQTVGCGNACITVVGENTISFGKGSFDHVAPVQTTFPVCNSSNNVPTINYIPITFKSSVDNLITIQANLNSVNNLSGQTAFLNLTGSTSDDSGNFWLEYPSTVSSPFSVPNAGVRALTFTVNNALLQNSFLKKTPFLLDSVPSVLVCDPDPASICRQGKLPQNVISSPTFTFTYQQFPGGGKVVNQEVTVSAYAILWPASSQIPNLVPKRSFNRTNSPTWSRISIFVCIGIFLVCLGLKTFVNYMALRTLKYYPQIILT
jgi:hypothetical protein